MPALKSTRDTNIFKKNSWRPTQMFNLLRIPSQARLSFLLSHPVAACFCRSIFTSAIQRQQSGLTYEQFIDGIGKQFEKSDRQRNWLGGDIVESVPRQSVERRRSLTEKNKILSRSP
jgi:hypothetical protein